MIHFDSYSTIAVLCFYMFVTYNSKDRPAILSIFGCTHYAMPVGMVAIETLPCIFYTEGKDELSRTMLDMAIVVCIIKSQCSHMGRYNGSLIDDCYFVFSYMMAHVAHGEGYHVGVSDFLRNII